MAGLIVFGMNYKTYEGKSQRADKPMPTGMDYSTDAMVAVLIAAGAKDNKIGGAVGDSAHAINIGEVMGDVVMVKKGLLTSPAELPLNAEYHKRMGEKATAVKGRAAGYVEVIEGVHISFSGADPHLTVYVYDAAGKVMGQKIHVNVEAEGTTWKFKSVG